MMSTRQTMRLLVLCLLAVGCMAMPLFIVKSGKAKCVTVHAAGGTTLRINYEAPDLVLKRTDKKYGRVWITAVLRPIPKLDQLKENPPGHGRRPSQPTSVELKDRKGSFTHGVDADGTVDVCIRASPASTKNPLLFGLSIEKEGHVEDPWFQKRRDVKTQKEQQQSAVEEHLSRMEREALTLESKMKEVLAEADYAKEREVVFHSQTLDMHAASVWWPVVQLSVLLVTGFTQASHIVRFFKSRRII